MNRTGIVKRTELCSVQGPGPVIPGGLSVRETAARDRHQMLPDEHAAQYRMQTLHIARIPAKPALAATIAAGPAPACPRPVAAGHQEFTGQPGLRGVFPACSAGGGAGRGRARGTSRGPPVKFA